MITNARVLQDEFVPAEIQHRAAHVSHLSDTLRPVVDGDRPEPSFLYGPSGAGKTCIAKHTLDQLREEVLELNHQYVNCWTDHTRFKTLYRILDGINKTADVHRQSTPHDELLERLRDYTGPQYIVILDEVDQLEDKGLLYDLHQLPRVTTVLIANSQEAVFGQIDDRLSSRLTNCARIKFDRYKLDQLITILRDRVQSGLRPDAVGEDKLPLIADYAAGDARVAIGTLRNAAKTAHREGTSTITREQIEEAVPETKRNLRQKRLEQLTADQCLLYEIICEEGEIDPEPLYEQYELTASDPKSRRMVRNYLSKLTHYELVEAVGQTKGRTYRLTEPDL